MATQAPHHSDTHDAQLVLRAQDGDRHAFTELFARHAQPAWRLALAVGGSVDIAAPAVAKGYTLTLVRLRRATTTLAVPFRHLVTRTCAETAASASRRDDAPADPGPNELADAFLALPERWRAALWLTTVEGGTPAQIAPIVGLSEEGAASLVDRARTGLQARYARSTPLGAYLFRDAGDLRAALRALAVPMPPSVLDDAVAQWSAWRLTLDEERRQGLASVVSVRPGTERLLAGAAAAIMIAGLAAAMNLATPSSLGEPLVGAPNPRREVASSASGSVQLPIRLNAPARPAKTTRTASSVRGIASDHATSAGATVGSPATGAPPIAAPEAPAPAAPSAPEAPADSTDPAPAPSTTVGGTVADTPVAVTADTGGVGVTVGDTTVGNETPTAPDSGVTVTADPGGGLPPIAVHIP